MKKGNIPPNIGRASRQFRVNRPGDVEGIWQPLYNYQTYANAGQSVLTFFQNPIGQSANTIEDTNMTSAGAMPAPKKFLATSVEVVFFPGVPVGVYGAQAVANHQNDVQAFMEAGELQFFIGSKSYLDDAPLGVFPQGFRMAGVAAVADASTAGADQQSRMNYGVVAGKPYNITPIMLVANQNFNVTLNWPNGVVALPSGVDGRIGVRLGGFEYRLSQ